MVSAVRTATKIEECRDLWNTLSPKASLYDLWEYRIPFWEMYGFEPAFVVLERDGRPEGLLPLWHHPVQNVFLWFGDTGDGFQWQEDTAPWIRNPADFPALLQAAPRPLLLTSLRHNTAAALPKQGLHSANPKSVLPLAGIASAEAYIGAIGSGNTRSILRRSLKKIREHAPDVAVNDPGDYEAFVALNTSAFDDSPFHDARLVHTFSAILQAGRRGAPFTTRTLSVRIDGKPAAVYCTFQHRKTFYALLYGAQKDSYPGIGHFLNCAALQDAITLCMENIDYAETEPGTIKEKLFPTVPQYTFTLP